MITLTDVIAIYSYLLCVVIMCYLIGSIPFGLLFTKMAGLGDIRKIGSGNIGATNVLRTGNKKLAIATLLADMLKGTIAVKIGTSLAPSSNMVYLIGLAPFLGHLFPIFLRFKGGKGVATYLGILLAFSWQGALIYTALFLIVAYLLRYSSLAALVSCALVPAMLYIMPRPEIAIMFTLMSIMVFWKERGNIKRLIAGTEPKIGDT
jgi:acyl phosphate:glycerol-3-phosphate acyltransferase